jgi:hypothetical protein
MDCFSTRPSGDHHGPALQAVSDAGRLCSNFLTTNCQGSGGGVGAPLNYACPNDSTCVKANCGPGCRNLCATCATTGAREGTTYAGLNGGQYTCRGGTWRDAAGNVVPNSNGCPLAWLPNNRQFAVTVQAAGRGEVLAGFNGGTYTCHPRGQGSGWVSR